MTKKNIQQQVNILQFTHKFQDFARASKELMRHIHLAHRQKDSNNKIKTTVSVLS